MKLTIKTDTDIKYIQFWNSFFNLTTREIEVLAVFLSVNRETKDKNLCSYDNKVKVAEILKLDDKNKLNNYIKRFKDKGAINLKYNNYVPHRLFSTKQDITVKVVRTYR